MDKNRFSTAKKRENIHDALVEAQKLAGDSPINSFIVHKTREVVPDTILTPGELTYI